MLFYYPQIQISMCFTLRLGIFELLVNLRKVHRKALNITGQSYPLYGILVPQRLTGNIQ